MFLTYSGNTRWPFAHRREGHYAVRVFAFSTCKGISRFIIQLNFCRFNFYIIILFQILLQEILEKKVFSIFNFLDDFILRMF